MSLIWHRRAALNTPRRQNVLLYSQTLSNAVWSKVGAVVGGKVLAPDGTMTADSITGPATSVVRQIGLSDLYSVGTQFVASVWYRAAVSPVTIAIEFLDQSDGVPAYASACNVTTTWQRFFVAGVIGAGPGPSMSVYLGSRFNLFPTTQAIEMWGAQMEFNRGPYPTEYTPTQGARVA